MCGKSPLLPSIYNPSELEVFRRRPFEVLQAAQQALQPSTAGAIMIGRG